MLFYWFTQCIPQISSLSVYTTVAPLAIVLGITMLKDLIDDIVSWNVFQTSNRTTLLWQVLTFIPCGSLWICPFGCLYYGSVMLNDRKTNWVMVTEDSWPWSWPRGPWPYTWYWPRGSWPYTWSRPRGAWPYTWSWPRGLWLSLHACKSYFQEFLIRTGVSGLRIFCFFVWVLNIHVVFTFSQSFIYLSLEGYGLVLVI